MGGAGSLLLAIVGVWLFLQVVGGGFVGRILSYAGETSAAAGGVGTRERSRRTGPGRLRVGAGVKRGDPRVLEVIRPAIQAVGGGTWTVISWHRPGAVTRSGSPSCHRFGKGTRKGALDLVPPGDDWSLADELVIELQQTPGVGEIVFRGDGDHDPDLDAKAPHVHAAAGCS